MSYKLRSCCVITGTQIMKRYWNRMITAYLLSNIYRPFIYRLPDITIKWLSTRNWLKTKSICHITYNSPFICNIWIRKLLEKKEIERRNLIQFRTAQCCKYRTDLRLETELIREGVLEPGGPFEIGWIHDNGDSYNTTFPQALHFLFSSWHTSTDKYMKRVLEQIAN
jgi:hypothetical protein